MNYGRRDFLAAAVAAAAPLTAATPIGDIKPSLYSITFAGVWYRGEALTMDQLLDRCKAYGYEGLELEGKRPHGCAIDWPKKRCQEYAKKASGMGIAIAGVAGNNDFSSPVQEHREANLIMARDMIRMTADLGSKVYRVFLAWTGSTRIAGGGSRYDIAQKMWDVAHEDFKENEYWAWCRECFIECSRYAAEHGVTVALQNHGPIINKYTDMLRMIREVNQPNFKACLDVPIMENKEAAYVQKAVREVGALQVQSHYGGHFVQEAPGKPIRQLKVIKEWRKPYIHTKDFVEPDFYLPFITALLETGYKGYIGYELCSPLPAVNGQPPGLDFADRMAKLGAEYMRGVIAQAKKNLAAVKSPA